MDDFKDTKEVVYEVLTKLYAEASPPLDFQDVIENPDNYGNNWYKNHSLRSDKQQEIVDYVLEKYDNELTQRQKQTVHMEAMTRGPYSVTDDE